MGTYTTTTTNHYWLILPHVGDNKTMLVPLDNISHIVPAEKHEGAFVYLKSHGYAVETTWSVDTIIDRIEALA